MTTFSSNLKKKAKESLSLPQTLFKRTTLTAAAVK